jgi:hypothetical protein
MAKMTVTSDDETVRVRIALEDDEEGRYGARCNLCGEANIVADTHEQWNLEDTANVAELHVDFKH